MNNQKPWEDRNPENCQELALRRKVVLGLGLAPMAALLPQVVEAEDSADSDAAKGDADVHFTDVSVHDPSVIRVGHTWYVFGSHLAAAKSDDLMNWQMIASGVDDNNRLFNNVTQTLSEAFAWSQSSTLWAPDVSQLPDGRFAFYYNACKGDSPRSAMGLAIANDIEGPYWNQGIFLKSGMWGQVSADGVNVYNPSVHPNAVDPQSFVDASGNRWLLYGSYSGGLFILKLDQATGLPVPGQGYGKHLVGGNHAPIEGGYILYSPQVKWYYLFMSFGAWIRRAATTSGLRVRANLTDLTWTAWDGPWSAARPIRASRCSTPNRLHLTAKN